MCGPFSWRDADIMIHEREPTSELDEGLTSITDSKAGFELRVGGVALLYSPTDSVEYLLDEISKTIERNDS
jgi:hypothetical protein